MKNYKRILAAIGTAALLVSNLGAVSQVVFAEEGDVVEDVVDVSEDDVTAQVQEIIDQALEEDDDAPAVEEEIKDEEPDAPAEPEVKPAEEPGESSTEPAEEPGELSTEPTEESGELTTEPTEESTELTTEPTEEPGEPTEETEEPALVSDAFDNSVKVEGTDDKISVHATAAENVIPNGAELKASLITREDDEKEYDKVEQALVDSDNVDYTAEDAEANAAAEESDADEQTETTNAGFIAMDIRFEVYDAENDEWSEVEPQGDVSITFDIAQDVLPVGVDEDSVTVHHLEEDPDTGDVEKVVTVADTTSNPDTGNVEVAEAPNEETAPAAAAEFTVDNFSAFVIYWSGTALELLNENEAIYVHYVDSKTGEEFVPANAPSNIKEGNATSGREYMIDLRFFAIDIEGRTFEGIKAKGRVNRKNENKYDAGYDDVQFIKWVSIGGIGKGNVLRYYSFGSFDEDSDDDDDIKYNKLGQYGQAVDVFIVYSQGRGSSYQGEVSAPSVGGDKQIALNKEGTFDLTLDVTTSSGEKDGVLPVDVLFVLDTSSSMVMNKAGSVTRAEAAKNAIIAAEETLAKNKNIDPWYGLVTFSTFATLDSSVYTKASDDRGDYVLTGDGNYLTYDKTKYYYYNLIYPFYHESNNMKNGHYVKAEDGEYYDRSNNTYNKHTENFGIDQILSSNQVSETTLDSITFTGDTNFESAMIATRQAMEHARTNAKKVVIFLTDGTPTRSYSKTSHGDKQDDGTLQGTGKEKQSDDKKQTYLTRAITELKSKGLHLSGDTKDAFYAVSLGATGDNHEKYIKTLASSSNFANGVTTKAIKVKDNDNELITQFKNIIAEATSVDAQEVVIEDPLSENVELVNNSSLSVVVTDANGNAVADADPNTDGFQVKQKNENGDEETYTITPSVVEDESGNQTVKLTFPAGYTLESGWTYKVVAKVQPTETLYTEYRKSLFDTDYQYDEGAGAYDDKKGWYTNGHTGSDGTDKVAKITYKYKNAAGTLVNGNPYEYADKPVITPDDMLAITGNIVITKNIVGLNGTSSLSSAEKNTQFVIKVTQPSSDPEGTETVIATQTITLNDTNNVTKAEENGKTVYTIKVKELSALKKGLNYKITEQEADGGKQPGDISGEQYAVVNDKVEASGTITSGDNTQTFTNTYKKMVVTGVETDNNMVPAVVATIDIMAAMFVIYHIAKRRVR